jgi:type IX secretion system PorP/SprF family membrane protein
MSNMKKYIFIMILALSCNWITAQQELMISQYMFNGLVLNPAYAGSHSYWSATALHRSQWVKFDKAPSTQTAAIDGRIAGGKLGLGFNLSNDAIGVTNQFDLGVNLSSRVSLGAGFLSAGIRLGASRYSANLTDLDVYQDGDPVYANNINGEIAPRLGAGLYYYQRTWFVGISVPSILAMDEKIANYSEGMNSFYRAHAYLNAGVVIESSPDLAFKPSILVKMQGNAPVEVDLNLNILMLRKFWIGAGYRTGDALIAMLEWNITNQLRIGYAFDYTLSDLQRYSNNSHEVMLGYDFGKDVNIKARSPRYF